MADPAGEASDVEGPDPSRDPGLARERTQLAWNRSGLAVLVVVAILFRRLWPLEGARSVLALVLVAVGAGVWAVGMWLALRTRVNGRAADLLGVAACRTLTLATVLLAVAGLFLALFTT